MALAPCAISYGRCVVDQDASLDPILDDAAPVDTGSVDAGNDGTTPTDVHVPDREGWIAVRSTLFALMGMYSSICHRDASVPDAGPLDQGRGLVDAADSPGLMPDAPLCPAMMMGS